MINGGLGSSRTGPAKYHGGDGGNVHITGGGSAGNHVLNDRAGNVILEGGKSNGAGIGGSIQLLSGAGSESGVLLLETRATESFTESGAVWIKSGNVREGFSGDLMLDTGRASHDRGETGSVSIRTGDAGMTHPHGVNPYSHIIHRDDPADIESAGSIDIEAGTSWRGIGGHVNIAAGAGNTEGGMLNMTAGPGLSRSIGGDTLISGGESKTEGGSVVLQGGFGHRGNGGDVELLGGDRSVAGQGGGNIRIQSGPNSVSGKEGAVVITSAESSSKTSYSAHNPPSGSTTLTSGKSSNGASGGVRVMSGESSGSNSGEVVVQSGQGSISGPVRITSGGAASRQGSGDVELTTGPMVSLFSKGSSGNILVGSSDVKTEGDSGEVTIRTGSSGQGSSGNITLATVSKILQIH